ncbi:hypothetical protein CNMCM7927_003081 [Aspergillus lentulus]|nr:hypothetical protein CNMCM7927_003081 [Aspergillus lentulus]
MSLWVVNMGKAVKYVVGYSILAFNPHAPTFPRTAIDYYNYPWRDPSSYANHTSTSDKDGLDKSGIIYLITTQKKEPPQARVLEYSRVELEQAYHHKLYLPASGVFLMQDGKFKKRGDLLVGLHYNGRSTNHFFFYGYICSGTKTGLVHGGGGQCARGIQQVANTLDETTKRQKLGLVAPESHLPALPDSTSRLNSGASASVWLMDWDEHYLSGVVTWKFVQLSLFMFVG